MAEFILPHTDLNKIVVAQYCTKHNLNFNGVIHVTESDIVKGKQNNIINFWFQKLVIGGIASAYAERSDRAHYVLTRMFAVPDGSEYLLITIIDNKEDIFELKPENRMLRHESYINNAINHLKKTKGILNDHKYLFAQVNAKSYVISGETEDPSMLRPDNVELKGSIIVDGSNYMYVPAEFDFVLHP